MSTSIPPAKREDFLIEEYKLLFQRNEQAQQNRWRFMQFYMLGLGAFYTALFSNDMSLAKSPALAFLVWLPVVFAITGGVLAWGLRQGMRQRAAVMAEIEVYFEAPGWERVRLERAGSTFNNSRLTKITYVFWSILIIGTVLVATFTIRGLFVPPQGG